VIERAFRRGQARGRGAEINSPGRLAGAILADRARIRRLAEEKDVPVYAFVEDLAASGGYWLASAADEIWADRTRSWGRSG
jgi:ClpP class serine protease